MLDLFVILTLCPVLAPLTLLVGLLIWATMGRPILFRQVRAGYLSKPFTLFKFRTMSFDTNRYGELMPDDKRLTKLGSFLRRFSLDEVPQVWNVLRGELSIVGPRPLLVRYLDRYTPEQARRHDVLPGITGWAQVNGRNALSWEQKFALDVWYVDNFNLWIDLRILGLTIRRVLSKKDISQPGYATAEEFRGSNR